MKRFIAYLFAILCIGLTFNLSAKDLTGLLKALEVSKQSSVSIDLDKISKEYGYKNFKSFIKDFKKKNKIKRLSVEDATIYFAGYDPDLEIKESKENIDKLHQLILSNQIFRSNTDYFKKKNSNKLKWLAVSVDYKKEMAKITTNSNLKKISPFVWGVSSYAAGAISACEREKVYLKIFGPECILVDISKNKQYLNVITPKEKIEMCKENSLLLFPDLFKIPDLDIKNKRYISYCSSDLFSLAGVAEIDRTIDLMLQEIEKNKYLYAKLPNNISSNIKKIDKTEPSQTQDVAEDEKRQKEEQILAEQKAEEEKKEDEKLKLEEQILAQQKAEEESKKADIRKKKTNQNSNFLGFLSNPTLWLIFGIILISILIYQLKLLQKLKEYLLKWNNKNNKLLWWIILSSFCVFIVSYLILTYLENGSINNKQIKLVSPIGKSNAEVAQCIGFLTTVNNEERNLKIEQDKFLEMHKPFLSKIQTIMNKISKETWVNNHRIENIKNLMSNYSEIEKELYYNLAVGQKMYDRMNSTQRGIMRFNCSVIN